MSLARELIQELMPRCESCGKPSPPFLCVACFQKLSFQNRCGDHHGLEAGKAWDKAHVAFDYDSDVIKAWLWKLKEKAQGERFLDLQREHLPPQLLDTHYDGIVAFPGDPLRSNRRLFDVADYLGIRLSKLLGRPYYPKAFVRKAFLSSLKDLGAERRRLFIPQLVSLRPEFSVSGCLLLVDDVMTSGASLDWGAQLLKSVAKRVEVFVLARKMKSK